MELAIIATSTLCLLLALALVVKKRRHDSKQNRPATPVGDQGGRAAESVGATSALNACLYLELAAAMLKAGLATGQTVQELARVSQTPEREILELAHQQLSAGKSWQASWAKVQASLLEQEQNIPESLEPLVQSMGFLASAGAPTAELLEVLAARRRRVGCRRAEKSAAKLSVKLVVPLGLCSLPAFICWGILPVLFALVPSLGLGGG